MIGPYELGPLLLANGVIVVAAMVQGSVGLGFAIVSVPLLTLISPLMTPVPEIILSLPMTLYMALRERKYVNLRETGWLFVGRAVGIGSGWVLLMLASMVVLHLSIATAVYAAAFFMALERPLKRTPLNTWACGVASGVMSVISAIGGPAVAILYKGESGPVIRANMAAIFAIAVCMTLTLLAATGVMTRTDLVTAALFAPALFVGLFLSRFLMYRIQKETIRILIMGLALVSATLLTLTTLYQRFG